MDHESDGRASCDEAAVARMSDCLS